MADIESYNPHDGETVSMPEGEQEWRGDDKIIIYTHEYDDANTGNTIDTGSTDDKEEMSQDRKKRDERDEDSLSVIPLTNKQEASDVPLNNGQENKENEMHLGQKTFIILPL